MKIGKGISEIKKYWFYRHTLPAILERTFKNIDDFIKDKGIEKKGVGILWSLRGYACSLVTEGILMNALRLRGYNIHA